MSSLYIHIPFCHHKCIYCDFYSIAQKFDFQPYIEALITELCHRRTESETKLESIYFGGGTPSLLNTDTVKKLMETIVNNFELEQDCEISFEANPENISLDYAKELKQTGINRISLGIQSFKDSDLKLLNRSHNSLQAKKSIGILKQAGFENISIDLISNLPRSTQEDWVENLNLFLSYKLTHISCYALMREKGTMMDKLLERKKLELLSEENALKQIESTNKILEENGYVHYETSSYTEQGYESVHNMGYWTFRDYIGIGAGAHSFDGKRRMWNEDNTESYIQRMKDGNFSFENREEILTQEDKYNEYIMLAVRIPHGLKLSYIKEHFEKFYNYFERQTDVLIRNGLLSCDLELTAKGQNLQNRVIVSLMI